MYYGQRGLRPLERQLPDRMLSAVLVCWSIAVSLADGLMH